MIQRYWPVAREATIAFACLFTGLVAASVVISDIEFRLMHRGRPLL